MVQRFSPKQRLALTWWCDASAERERDAIICDGAVRSGKTYCLGLSFVLWAMARYSGEKFALCGKTILSIRRNVVDNLTPQLRALGFVLREKRSENRMQVSLGDRQNDFFLFGGRDEGASALIQGITLAGALLDEVALMPRSFVEQTAARCSVEGSKLWFSCNPEGPEHWFYREWICRAETRNALYLHFTMEDNPGLSRKIRARYARMYSGVFRRRFVLGEWVAAQGLVYDFFRAEMAVEAPPDTECERFAVSCDYGTANPASFGLWGLREGVWYRLREYYYDSRKEGRQKTDSEYAAALGRLVGALPLEAVVVDPSAASFLELLRREGMPVRKADNDVLRGIRVTAELLKAGRIRICRGCHDCLREIAVYCWDEKNGGRDQPLKCNDHAMDDLRYFAATIAGAPRESFASVWVER